MTGSIFVIDEDENVMELKETKYENEDLFQRLIESYPGILGGDQITPDEPRKWIFVSREMGVPSVPDGGSQWFLDHLFLDQDAIPTLEKSLGTVLFDFCESIKCLILSTICIVLNVETVICLQRKHSLK